MTYEEMSAFWIKGGELFEQTCQAMDQVWQKRKRVIDTRLLVTFTLKMILSKNRQGYGSSLSALWEACSDKGILMLLQHRRCVRPDRNCQKQFSKHSIAN
ncbi:MAG: hypothetical protein V4525_06090 [Pseudomonadota bacterium]